ncbi:hypothetical protein LIER_07259 [Lithospermum erythrorhizon]|uniref:Maturase K n=1 Tax=Lithospermum erythrorhizon TaxID=34254 RepID=A0AAV3P8S4_LITER
MFKIYILLQPLLSYPFLQETGKTWSILILYKQSSKVEDVHAVRRIWNDIGTYRNVDYVPPSVCKRLKKLIPITLNSLDSSFWIGRKHVISTTKLLEVYCHFSQSSIPSNGKLVELKLHRRLCIQLVTYVYNSCYNCCA